MMHDKKLYRSQKDKVLFGVCGGLGQYFGVDATILRLLSILVIVFTGLFPGVFVYLLAALVMPMQEEQGMPVQRPVDVEVKETKTEG